MGELKFIKQIGQGGFGNVDLVEDEDGNHFARKTFAKNQPLADALLANVLKRFQKEARIQGGIVHPNIVPVLGSDFKNYPPSYLMPLASGNLADDIDADRVLGGNFVAAISDIVSGLEEMHSMEIFHRDLKPQNVLRFDTEDVFEEKSYYAVSDFGLISMKESQLSMLTKTGMRKSSDYYTAPEITKDLKAASVQSDIYSLGCILHDMVGTEERVPCGEIREPGPFAAIFLGCTRKDPAQRFKSAKAVLDAILSVEFEPATPPSKASGDFIAKLDAGAVDSDFWTTLTAYLEDDASTAEKVAVFGKMSSELIKSLCEQAPAPADRFAVMYASWVAHSAFGFEYCDAVANRVEEFFGRTNFEAKVACLMALLWMGTSHNRWYVERRFFRLCAPDMEENLAKRLAVQFRIDEDDVCSRIDHLERSITVDRADLHPALVKALADVCT